MNRLIVESYNNSTINTILNDISKKYRIDTSKEQLSEDRDIQEVKFKYRTYSECIRMLYNSAGYKKT
jgi:short-subunit dehydrogenase